MRTAGIVVYNPEIKRLQENIKAVLPQVDCLFLYMNSPIDLELICDHEKIIILNDGKNNGIAKALNSIMNAASENESNWCLLLDQDSIVTANYIEKMEQYVELDSVAIITSQIVDINENEKIKHESIKVFEEIDMCITSGSYNNIAVWKSVGQFREEFFIDYVDWEYCARVRERGYKIYKLNSIELSHELGKRTYHSFLGRRLYTFNHSAFRKYYISRNMIVTYRLFPEEKQMSHPYLRIIKRFMITLLYETDKVNKLKAILRGTLDSGILFNQLKESERK